jgi:hypothetical protein
MFEYVRCSPAAGLQLVLRERDVYPVEHGLLAIDQHGRGMRGGNARLLLRGYVDDVARSGDFDFLWPRVDISLSRNDSRVRAAFRPGSRLKLAVSTDLPPQPQSAALRGCRLHGPRRRGFSRLGAEHH